MYASPPPHLNTKAPAKCKPANESPLVARALDQAPVNSSQVKSKSRYLDLADSTATPPTFAQQYLLAYSSSRLLLYLRRCLHFAERFLPQSLHVHPPPPPPSLPRRPRQGSDEEELDYVRTSSDEESEESGGDESEEQEEEDDDDDEGPPPMWGDSGSEAEEEVPPSRPPPKAKKTTPAAAAAGKKKAGAADTKASNGKAVKPPAAAGSTKKGKAGGVGGGGRAGKESAASPLWAAFVKSRDVAERLGLTALKKWESFVKEGVATSYTDWYTNQVSGWVGVGVVVMDVVVVVVDVLLGGWVCCGRIDEASSLVLCLPCSFRSTTRCCATDLSLRHLLSLDFQRVSRSFATGWRLEITVRAVS